MDDNGNITPERLRRIDREVESKVYESLVNCSKCLSGVTHDGTYDLNGQPSYPATTLSGLRRAGRLHRRRSRAWIGTTTSPDRAKAPTELTWCTTCPS
jgi:hypothetical protein